MEIPHVADECNRWADDFSRDRLEKWTPARRFQRNLKDLLDDEGQEAVVQEFALV